MTADGATTVVPRIRPRLLAVAVVGSLLGTAAVHVGSGRPERQSRSGRAGLETLPLAAQGPISAAVGRALPGYRVVGLAAHNPAQGFDVRFSQTGATVAAGAATLGMTLSAYGYGSSLRSVAPVAPRAGANRVSYAHGALTEWWANGPLGLEQGFDIASRPSAGSGPLTLSIGLSGGLAARLERGSVVLSGSDVSLSYGGLVATDAHGRVLRSQLALHGDRVRIEVDDRGASYPLRIDPVVREAARLTASHPKGDALGWSVSVSGDLIVVGAPATGTARHGKALVFVKPGSGWAGSRKPTATLIGGSAVSRFGWSVSASGRTIVVGAPGRFQEPGVHDAGSAYVFVKPRAGWSGRQKPTATLAPSTLAAGDVFGEAVSVSGDTVVVGAEGADVGSRADVGAAYVFVKPGSGWRGTRREAATLRSSDGAPLDLFGSAVGVSGSTIVVGAWQHARRGGLAPLGGAYVFTRPKPGWHGTHSERARLKPTHHVYAFGRSVAISAETIAVGTGTVAQNGKYGDAWVFVRPQTGWRGTRSESARLIAPERQSGASCGERGETAAASNFGLAIAVAGGKVVVSAGGSRRGTACVYAKPPGGWSGAVIKATTLVPSDGARIDGFGSLGGPSTVAASGGTIVIGSPQHKIGRQRGAGEAYVY